MCRTSRFRFVAFVLFGSWLSSAASAAEAPKAAADLRAMPVREVTVFKDGHAFVLREGLMPADPSGKIFLDRLPSPVLGTFWPYAAGPSNELRSVVAGKHEVSFARTAVSLRELLEANIGAEFTVTESTGAPYGATLLAIPERGADDCGTTASPPGEGPAERGQVALLRTEAGVKVVALDRIQDVTFKAPPKPTFEERESRDLLTLELDGGGRSPAREAEVGLLYLQKGLRWVPSYKVALDGKGGVILSLQATLVNELDDLSGVTVNLVVGVPSFAFRETLDPMALQRDVARLSSAFQSGNQTAYALSNAIMTQAAMNVPQAGEAVAGETPAAMGDTQAEQTEDLFVFTVEGVTLKRGERMVLPVAEYASRYEDVYKLVVPWAPPKEVLQNLGSDRQAELARALAAPKVKHVVRIRNAGSQPFTTAPALITLGDRLLAQSLMTYTPHGASAELEVTTAVDIPVRKSETEVKQIPNAAEWEGYTYARRDLAGVLTLTNRKKVPVAVEVTRRVLGNIDGVSREGAVRKMNWLEDPGAMEPGGWPYWWNWYSWPSWWGHFNGAAEITWRVALEPAASVDLEYGWHYFWR